MKFGSLFSGIGGLDLGLERAGMECIWQVEIDNYCQRILIKHWPNIPKFGDIKDVGAHNLETPDLICGGFPCQPVSLAGKREAQADTRWLWPEFARVVDELQPRYVLVENVPGLYTAGGSEVLADLATFGYNAEWHSIPASAVGAPHLRYRIFIVGWNPDGGNRNKRPFKEMERRKDTESAGVSTDVADTTGGSEQSSGSQRNVGGFQDALCREGRDQSYWTVEPDIRRVAHGIPSRVDRLRGLGNAVVPQVAEWISRGIMEFENDRAA